MLDLVRQVRGGADGVRGAGVVVVEDAEVLARDHPEVVRLARVHVRIVVRGGDGAPRGEGVDVGRVCAAEDLTRAVVLHHDREDRPGPSVRTYRTAGREGAAGDVGAAPGGWTAARREERGAEDRE